GYGKGVSVLHETTGLDPGTEYRYHDPRLMGSRVDLTSVYTSAALGTQTGVVVQRPFFSLDTPYEWRVLWARTVQQDILYQDANQTTGFNQDFSSVTSEYGWKLSTSENLVQRLYGGTYYEKDS